MKRIFSLTLVAVCIATIMIACGESSKKDVKDLDENLKDAAKDVKEGVVDVNSEAKVKAAADWRKFKNESDSTIAGMDRQLQEFKVKIAKTEGKEKQKLTGHLENVERRLNQQKEILSQRNAEFETDLKSFNETVTTKNETFKKEFKLGLKELGAAFSDLFKG